MKRAASAIGDQNRFVNFFFLVTDLFRTVTMLVMMQSSESCKCFGEEPSMQIIGFLHGNLLHIRMSSLFTTSGFFTIKFEAFSKLQPDSPHLSEPETFSPSCQIFKVAHC